MNIATVVESTTSGMNLGQLQTDISLKQERMQISFIFSHERPLKQQLQLINKQKKCFNTLTQSYLHDIAEMGGHSLQEIARFTSIPYSTIKKLASGATKKPREKIFNKILGLYCAIYYKVYHQNDSYLHMITSKKIS